MKKVAFLLLLSLSILVSSQAQVKIFTTAKDTISADSASYTTEIKVANYNQIIGTQFTLRWDSTIFNFVDVADLGMEEISYDNHFGRQDSGSGILRFAWFNESLVGIDLPDSTTLFSVEFEILDNTTEKETAIWFSDDPTLKEVADTSFGMVPAEFIDGFVRVLPSATVSSVRNNPEELNILALSPNPVKNNSAQLTFFLKKTDTLSMRLVSMNGQELQRNTQVFQAGKHKINLDINDDVPSGIYLLRLESESFFANEKLIIHH